MITEKFPAPWVVVKLLVGYKVESADGVCLAIFSASPEGGGILTWDDAYALASIFAAVANVREKRGSPPKQKAG